MIRFFFRTLRAMARSESTRLLFGASIAVLTIGTVFYRYVEDLSWVDSWYFTVVTLTTVGYGDISPETGAGKVFTSFYLLVGVALVVAFGSTLISIAAEERQARREEGGRH